MVTSISNIPKNTNVYRFITSGKPGNCKFCKNFVEKLEAHHTCYSPETTINLCHSCHHKTHFWINRLTEDEKLLLLKTRFHHNSALSILKDLKNNPESLRKYIAPSRNRFMSKSIKLDIKRISKSQKRGDKKVFKVKPPHKNKNISKKVDRYLKSSSLSD